jgi:hypothetical protein
MRPSCNRQGNISFPMEDEMERGMISWNIPNWITVLIMAAAGYAVLGVGAQLLKRGQTQAGGNTGGY